MQGNLLCGRVTFSDPDVTWVTMARDPCPTEAASNNAKFTFRANPDPLKGAAPAEFLVQLTDPAGKSISDAKVTVALVMPAMPSMSMPEMRASGDLAWNGNEYSGTVNVPMAGPWNTTIEATRSGQVLASQHVRLSAR